MQQQQQQLAENKLRNEKQLQRQQQQQQQQVANTVTDAAEMRGFNKQQAICILFAFFGRTLLGC